MKWHLHKVLNRRLSRRDALKTLGLGATALWLPGCSSLGPSGQINSDSHDIKAPELNSRHSLITADGRDFSPIDRSIGLVGPRTYSGDNPDRSHNILWNKNSYLANKGGLPTPTERVPLVVVGGGMSGIISSYLLRHHKPIILERADRFGGNSRGESWQGIDYSIGAAYFMEQPPESPLFKFYHETGIDRLWRVKTDEDPMVLNNKRYSQLWSGETAPHHAQQFKKLHTYFEKMFHRDGLKFPDMPTSDTEMLAYLKQLDQESFLEHLHKVGGGKLHPHIETALEHFSWSTLGSSISEISAAAGLNQYTSEFGNTYITPGGNSAVAERILQLIRKENPADCFRPGSVVIDVKRVADGVIVTYEDYTGTLRSIHSQAVIMACPKFVVKHILTDIEPSRVAAISKLRYTPYLVANVLVDGYVKDTFYDLFLLGDGHVDFKDVIKSADQQKATDVILGTYAKPNKDHTVLTLYRSLPFTAGRGLVYAPTSYEKYRLEFEQQINQEILPLVGIKKNQVKDIRLSRWGHPMPVPLKGLIADGTLDEIRRPFADRVFFIEQDNWLLPCIETAAQEALFWTPQIQKLL
ncbi:MAG: FAD-dependent oxidoreductase [Pseudobdellovibrionaceae bacterium]